MTLMTLIINFCAGILIAMTTLAVLCSPFTIGQPRKPFGAGTYLCVLLQCAATVLVTGRALGWW